MLSTGSNRTNVCWEEYKALVEILVLHLKGVAIKHLGNTFCISIMTKIAMKILKQAVPTPT